MRLIAPNGKEIIGTVEELRGVALINEPKMEDGKLTFDYSGQTDVDWDSQKTITLGRHRLFADSDGGTHFENELRLVPDEQPKPTTSND